jgi:metal-responsive CopG/Arc/MetJ family transcriptional regulator
MIRRIGLSWQASPNDIAALDKAAKELGTSRSEVIRRSIHTYLYVAVQQEKGATLKLHLPDGTVENVVLL